MDKIKEKITNTKILAAIGIAGMILGTFFAYFKVSFFGLTETISLLKYWQGYVIILAAAANALMIFKKYVEKYVPKILKGKFGEFLTTVENSRISLIPTAIVAVLVIYLHFSAKSSYINYGLGFYLELIGIISLGAYPFVYKGKSNITENTEDTNNEVE